VVSGKATEGGGVLAMRTCQRWETGRECVRMSAVVQRNGINNVHNVQRSALS
jgi:hypothetical protein